MIQRTLIVIVAAIAFYLSILSKNPLGIRLPFQKIPTAVEEFFKLCPCGGAFRTSASARCPHCRSPLSAIAATTYIEKSAAGERLAMAEELERSLFHRH
jgi:hypothetical protein